VAAGDNRKGTDDFEAVLALKGPPVHVKTMAGQRLARMESRTTRCDV
jgi:hypothetical protein